jgi:rhodanese-related sulfurtransferase
MRKLLLALLLGHSLLAGAEVVEIDNDELKALLAKGVPVVDLRTAGEWRQTGVVDGSHLLTLFDEQGRADVAAWSKAVEGIAAADQPLILICRTGNRSGKAARLLEQTSPKRRIYNVRAGITGWQRAAQPVVSVPQNLKHAGVKCGPVC